MKILFVVTNLGCGGINRALQNFLNYTSADVDNISVLVFDSTGQYSNGFNNANLIKVNSYLDYILRRLSDQEGLSYLYTCILKLIDKITLGKFKTSLLKSELRKLTKSDYDVIIAYSEGVPTHFLKNIKSKRTIAWIHCDYKSYLTFCKGREQQEIEVYENFDKIVCVSDYTKQTFGEIAPKLKGKVESIYNILDVNMMRQKAVEFTPKFNYGFNIVTVGRIDIVKRPSIIPEILSKIINLHSQVNWYIIGPTIWQPEYDKLISEINKYGLENHIHLLGQQDNPYPYIKHADLLVNTSVSEACPYVINEAKVLGTPVVCTDFGSAAEFIENGENGYSVSLDEMPQVILKLISDKALYEKIKSNLSMFEYDNEAIKNKFLSLL